MLGGFVRLIRGITSGENVVNPPLLRYERHKALATFGGESILTASVRLHDQLSATRSRRIPMVAG